MARTLWAAVALSGLALSGGCDDLYDAMWADDPGWYDEEAYTDTGSPLAVRQGALTSDFGEVEVAPDTAASVEGYGDATWQTVELMAQGGGGVAMAIVELDGWYGPTLAELRSGTYDLFEGGLMVTGCAGRRPGDWDADSLADRVIVDVRPVEGAPHVRRIRFTAFWLGSDETVSGSFEWTPPDTPTVTGGT